MNFLDVKDKYERDPRYRSVVEQMVHMAMSLEMSPGELREAAVFAEITVMSMRPVRDVFPEFASELDRELRRQEIDRQRAACKWFSSPF